MNFALFGLDAERTANRVADGLGTHYPGTHLRGGSEGIIDLEVARKPGPRWIVRAVPFEAKPFDAWAAIAERMQRPQRPG